MVAFALLLSVKPVLSINVPAYLVHCLPWRAPAVGRGLCAFKGGCVAFTALRHVSDTVSSCPVGRGTSLWLPATFRKATCRTGFSVGLHGQSFVDWPGG